MFYQIWVLSNFPTIFQPPNLLRKWVLWPGELMELCVLGVPRSKIICPQFFEIQSGSKFQNELPSGYKRKRLNLDMLKTLRYVYVLKFNIGLKLILNINLCDFVQKIKHCAINTISRRYKFPNLILRISIAPG